MYKKICMSGALAVFAIALLVGCTKPDAQDTSKLLKEAGQAGSFYGLKALAKKDEAAASEIALRLNATIEGSLLPYLNQGDLPAADVVRELIDSTLFTDLKPEIADAIVAAAIALDVVLPAPAPDTYLTPEQVGYIKAFLTGVANGCAKFTKGDKDVPIPQYKGKKELPKASKWLTGKSKGKKVGVLEIGRSDETYAKAVVGGVDVIALQKRIAVLEQKK